MQNAQQQEYKGADVWKNGGHKQEGKTTQGMARRHHQVGRYVASETEPDGVGQRKLEVDETGIGHLRALSPWLLMMMMMIWLKYSIIANAKNIPDLLAAEKK